MDWKGPATLILFAGTLIAAPRLKKIPKDLVYFVGGAGVLLLGLAPAKVFMANMTSGLFIACLFFFLLVSVAKELVIDRSLRIDSYRDLERHLPEHWLTLAFAGLFFMSAFQETSLPEELAKLAAGYLGGKVFVLVGVFLGAVFLAAQLLPPLFVFYLAYPFCLAALQLVVRSNDASIAAAFISLSATLFATLFQRTKERVHAKVRVPVLILIFFSLAFLIPQFLLGS